MINPMPTYTLYYFHDPMCSWCWGFRPTWTLLQRNLPPTVEIEYILGGLAPDNDAPMPQALRLVIQNTWQRIHKELGTEFNFNFWSQNTPRRSTYPACRAVIAASQQGKHQEMISAIQVAYYLRALNPSDTEALQLLAKEITLNESEFLQSMLSKSTDNLLKKQISHAKRWAVPGYPSLVLKLNKSSEREALNTDLTLSNLAHIPVDYTQHQKMQTQIIHAMEHLIQRPKTARLNNAKLDK